MQLSEKFDTKHPLLKGSQAFISNTGSRLKLQGEIIATQPKCTKNI